MNNDYEYNGTNENIPSFQERNNFTTNNMDIRPPRKRRKWPIVLLIILLIVVGILIYFSFFTDKLDFIKPDDKYSEFDPNKGKIESNSNESIKSNKTSNKQSNSNKPSNSNKVSNSNINKVVESISIAPKTPSVVVGSTISLKANITPSDAKDKTIVWKSSDTKIATVNSKGVVTGVKAGTATITATSKNGKKASVKVIVTTKKIPVTGIYLLNTNKTIDNDDTYQISYYVVPENATDKEVIFTSMNPSVAKVSSTGVITPVGIGKSVIKISTKDGKKTYNFTVFVEELDVQNISITNLDGVIYVGQSDSTSITYYPSYATRGKRITWSSSNESIATVSSSSGLVKGVSEGNAVIKATSEKGKTATQTVRVRLNQSEYHFQVEILTRSNQCYSYMVHNNRTFLNYTKLNYNGKTYPLYGNNLNLIPCNEINENVKTAQMVSKAGYVYTVNVKYSKSDV